MASRESKKRSNPTPDTASSDSFPINCEEFDSIESDDVVVRALKKRKLEENGGPRARSIFQDSQDDFDGSPQPSQDIERDSPLHKMAPISIGSTTVLDDTQSLVMLDRKPSNQRSSSASLDILEDPIFNFPRGPIRQDSIPIDLSYEIDDED
jgi:hypothetical protein